MLTTKLTKAIGGNSDVFTSQSFVFQGAVAESEQVMLIVLLSAAGEDVFTKIRNLGMQTEQQFFSGDDSPLPQDNNHPPTENANDSKITLTDRLYRSSAMLSQHLAEFQQKSILLAVLKDEVLYMLSSGDDKVLLHRDQKTTNLLHQGDTQLISGYLQPQDKVLFLTPRLDISGIGPTELPDWDQYFIQRLILSDQAVVEEEIASYLQQLEIPEPIAAVLLSTQSQIEISTEQRTVEDESDPSEQPQISHLRDLKPASKAYPKILALPKLNLPRVSIKLKRSLYRLLFPLSFKKLGIVAAIIVTAIIFLAVTIFQIQQKNQKQNQFSQALSQTRQNIAQAQNSKESDPEAAKQFLLFAKNALTKASEIHKDDSQLLTLQQELADAERQILKTSEITQWQTFLSLDLIRPDFNAKRMSLSLKKILLLDQNQKSLSLVDIETKSNQLLAGQTQLGNAQYASLNGDYAFVYSEDKGLLRIETNRRQLTTVAPPDKEWGRIVDVFGFSSNVYLLDAVQNQIWKYVPTASGYTEKQIYLRDNQGLEFNSAKQLFIDFSVWVVKEDAGINRFTAGNKEFYSIGGLDQPLSTIDALFAPEEEDKVFLLDSKNKRIVLTKKNGEYLSQYTSDLFGTATDLLYDESTKTLYLLEGGKIHQTNLQ